MGRGKRGAYDSHELGGLREHDGAITEMDNTGGMDKHRLLGVWPL